MEIEYRRTARGSYMILEGDYFDQGYEGQMLLQNDVPRLLKFHTMELNGKTQFWYDISGMRSFSDIIKSEGITVELLYGLFSAVEDAFRCISKYLISEEKLLLHPDALFFKKTQSRYSAALCFCPFSHEGTCEQLRELTRLLIAEVDHADSGITAFCYELYSVSESDEFSFCDLMERINGEYNGTKETEEADDIDWRMERAGIYKIDPVEEKEEKDEDPVEESSQDSSVLAKFLGGLRLRAKNLLPKVFTGNKRLMPEKREFRDIKFDEVPERYEGTVLLSEDMAGCRGKLIYESGGRGGSDILVDSSPFSIGSRQGGNNAVLLSDAVSRYHARIVKRDGSFYIEDLNSKNGTFINGEIMPYNEQKRLKRMDVISFADVVYRVV